MNNPERGPLGPETERTIRKIENEYRAKLGLPPLADPGTIEDPESLEKLVNLRQKWSDRDVSDH